MAKRAPTDEKPYNPIESALVERVSSRTTPGREQRDEMISNEVLESEAAAVPLELPKKPGREKRVILSWEDEIAIQQLLDELSQTLQTPIKLSNALRSCVILLRHAQEPITKKASRARSIVRPPNNDLTAIALFEQRLAGIFQAGIREASSLD
ncbi:MAG: hypothetical protein M3Y27_14855 [Acidobacteriota bacterium]|nr:hypothetical protein [Acidobacteriota bacterium]